MKKIASNVLIVSTQLIVGGLFLFMLFSDNEISQDVVVRNNNLNRMADSVTELFVADKLEQKIVDEKKEIELLNEQEAQKKREEEEAARKAKEEEERKAKEEEERKAREEAERKAQEEEAARRARASASQSVSDLQDYAHDLVINTYGWSEDDFTALVNLWTKESEWNIYCYNTSSGAYGIPQSLPGNKMASEGDDWETNGRTQIRWGLKYIQGRYGSPSGAWAHFLERNWY